MILLLQNYALVLRNTCRWLQQCLPQRVCVSQMGLWNKKPALRQHSIPIFGLAWLLCRFDVRLVFNPPQYNGPSGEVLYDDVDLAQLHLERFRDYFSALL